MRSQSSIVVKRGKGDLHQVYRPCKISEVYGQEEIKEVVRTGLDENSLGHSILFHGVSGTGKTTLGRIIAMGLNCKKGPTSEPCCECDSCREVMNWNAMSFVEINSSESTGIDNIRRITTRFAVAPWWGDRKRIYLFDECHGLTKNAQNALLKNVEDTREHVHFIFCSTEPKGILETLRNRCMEFEFKEVHDEIMWELLLDIILQEDYIFDEMVMVEIIKQVKGKPRNALNELQKAIAAGKFKKMAIPFEEVMRNTRERFGAIREDAERRNIQVRKEKEE